MSNLIDRKALCDDLREYKVYPVPISSDESEVKGYNDGIDLAISIIVEFPSAKLVRTAKVENISDYRLPINDYCFIKKGDCGNCGFTATEGDKYCRECGAKLDWSWNE